MNAAPDRQAPNIVIDRRPLWIVVIDSFRRELLLAALFAIFVFALNLEGPRDLPPAGYKVLCLFFLCVSLWGTNLIPLSVTSLMAMAAIPMLGIMKAAQVYSYFGNPAVFFILGALILSAAMIASGLSARLSLLVMETCGTSPRRLVTSIYLFGAVSSCIMSEHAVAAMLFPIVTEIVRSLKLDRKSAFAKSLYFALAWGCIIGGETTPLGTARVALAMAIIEKNTGGLHTLGMLQYSQMTVVHAVLMLVCGWFVLTKLFPPEISDLSPAREYLHRKFREMGLMTFREKGIAGVMLVTLFCWFHYGETLGLAGIAIVSVVAMFVFNLVNWKMLDEHVNWAIILMYGGAICLGEVLSNTGAALWLAQKLFGGVMDSPAVFLMCMALLATAFSAFMNGSAVVAVLLPPILSMSQTYHINPILASMCVILPSNFAFSMPIGTPASALVYSSGMLAFKETVRAGIILSALGLLCFTFSLFLYWPLLGIK